MKPKLLTLIFLITSSLPLFAQTDLPRSTFNWTDTVFTRGAVHFIHVEYTLDKSELTESSRDSLKVVANFMKENPFIKIEVDVNTDPRGSEKHNMLLSQARAQSVVNCLRSLGVDSARLIAKGWGFHKPLPGCSATDIAKMTSQADKEAAWQADRRTEVRIITDSANVFGWNDIKFMKYSKRIFHVLYELDKAELRQDSTNKICMDSVVRFLKSHPYLKVGVYNHTDAQGSLKHNMLLSQARAWTVANWLISAGIDSAQLVVKGWEAKRPIYTQQQIERMSTGDREKQQAYYLTNRRTELVILGTYYKK